MIATKVADPEKNTNRIVNATFTQSNDTAIAAILMTVIITIQMLTACDTALKIVDVLREENEWYKMLAVKETVWISSTMYKFNLKSGIIATIIKIISITTATIFFVPCRLNDYQ